MTEWKLFNGSVPYVSTYDFHVDRPRAPHLEQGFHQGRLHKAADMIREAARHCGPATVSDLGCGDGGLLSLLADDWNISEAWGYDFCPANEAGWTERRVTAYPLDVFGADWDMVNTGDIVVVTEVLEHLADPHGVLRRIRARGASYLVCSSPFNENDQNHSPEHAWAWDREGYAHMIMEAGWTIIRHEHVDLFQVVMAR